MHNFRYTPDHPEQFEDGDHIHIEITSVWTKREISQLEKDERDPVVYVEKWMRKKVVSIYIPVVGMTPITSIEDLTIDIMEDIDVRLYSFVMGVLYKAIADVFLSLSPSQQT